MVDDTIPRRSFLLSAGTAIATGLATTVPSDAQAPTVSVSEIAGDARARRMRRA